MNSVLLLAALAQLPVTDGLVIFGREPWFRAIKGDTETFVGVLEKIPGATADSRCAFTLVMALDGRNRTRDVFVAGNNAALVAMAGRRVQVVGMAVDLRVDGRMRYEIWPARVELAAGGGIVGPIVGPVGPVIPLFGGAIIAAANWNAPLNPGGLAIRFGEGQMQQIIRSDKDLLNWFNGNKQAVANIHRSLGIKDMNWKKHMMVFWTAGVQKSAGYQVELLGADYIGINLLVRWNLRPPPQGVLVNAVPTHPGKVIVVPRTEGALRFDPPVMR